MKKKVFDDTLIIKNGNNSINIEVAFGFLDRSYNTFNFRTNKNESVEGYNLALDLENFDTEKILELEDILSDISKLHEITLKLDGIIKQGRARIAQCFGTSGYCIDLEIHS